MKETLFNMNETLTIGCLNQFNQQPINDCLSSRKKMSNSEYYAECKETDSVTERKMDFLVKETTSPICHRVTGQKDMKRTQYEEAVLEAYGVVPMKGYFSSFPRKLLDSSPECGATAPSNVKAIIAGFLG